jgi:hypothetical protein
VKKELDNMETEITSLYPHFKDIDTKYKKEFKTFTWRGQEIKVSQYLPIDEKIALIDIALQKSMYNGMVHPLQLEKYYQLGLVYMYSNIVFSEEDRTDEAKIYDELYVTGLLNEVIKYIPTKELQTCADKLSQTKAAIEKHKVSAVGIIETIIQTLEEEVPNILDQINKVSPEQAQQLLSLIAQGQEAKE